MFRLNLGAAKQEGEGGVPGEEYHGSGGLPPVGGGSGGGGAGWPTRMGSWYPQGPYTVPTRHPAIFPPIPQTPAPTMPPPLPAPQGTIPLDTPTAGTTVSVVVPQGMDPATAYYGAQPLLSAPIKRGLLWAFALTAIIGIGILISKRAG